MAWSCIVLLMNQDQAASVTKKLELLQVLRALAAFIVTAGHVMHEAHTISNGQGSDFNYIPYPNGVGVDIFFVISGFVIVYASRDLVTKSGAWREFMLRRLIRVVPLYWFYTALMVAAIMLFPTAIDTASLEFPHVIKSLFFYPHMRPYGDEVRPLLALGWSLNYEMYFYVIFAVLMCMKSLRAVMIGLSLYLIVSVISAMIFPDFPVALDFWFSHFVLEFLAGAWIAYLFVNDIRLPRWFLIPFMVISAGLLCLLALPVFQGSDIGMALRFCIGALLVGGVVLPRHAEYREPSKILTVLGDSSYSLYLSHPFVIGGMKLVWIMLGLTMSLWIYVGVTLVACLIGGYLSYRLVEKPALECLKRLYTR